MPGNLSLRCYYFRAMLAQQLEQERERALNEARDLYLSGRSRPDTCDPLFAALEQAGRLGDDLVLQRLQLAFRDGSPGLMRYLRSELDARPYRDQADMLLNLYHRPADVRLINQGELPVHMVIAAMERLARSDPDLAWHLLPVLGTRFSLSEDQRAQIAGRAAWYAVIRDGPGSHGWLDGFLASQHDGDLLEQRARVAVREQDWPGVLEWTARMPASQQQEANWRYWRGRALLASGAQEAGEAVLHEAAKQRSYWGFLAAETLAVPYPLNKQAPPAQLLALDEPSSQAVIRVRLLLQAEEASLARDEWLKLIRDASHQEQLALAALATRNSWAHLAVEAALFSGQHDLLDWRFPTAMAEHFEDAAADSGVDALLLMSVARRESAFNPHARSPVGARGLMQLMPATAREVAAELGTPTPDSDDLLDRDLNLQLGSHYLAGLLSRYGGNRVLALAAYNAGPHRVDRWLREAPQPFDVFIESIPFRETREYVQAVLAYRVIFGDQLQRPEIALMTDTESRPMYGPVMLAGFTGVDSCGTC